MKKFEIMTDRFEVRFSTPPKSQSAQDVWELYESTLNEAKLEASFDTLEEAKAEFQKRWANHGSTRMEKGYAYGWLLLGDVAYIVENEYDEDGEFDHGGDVWEYSAAPYSDGTRYSVKPEFIDRWTNEAVDELIVTADEIADLANGWSMTVEELMEQVEEA